MVQKKTHPKKLPKTVYNRQKQRKNHANPYKETNTIDVFGVKLCAESNGTTPEVEKLRN